MSRQRELEIWLHRLVEAHEEVPGSVDPMHTPAMRLFMLDRANQPPPVQQKIVANNQLYIISEKLATAPGPWCPGDQVVWCSLTVAWGVAQCCVVPGNTRLRRMARVQACFVC